MLSMDHAVIPVSNNRSFNSQFNCVSCLPLLFSNNFDWQTTHDFFALAFALALCERALTVGSAALASLMICEEIAQDDS